MTITDSNTPLTDGVSIVSLRAERAAISASSVAVVSGWYLTSGEVSPTAQGSEVTMAQGGGRWGVWGSWGKIVVVGFLNSHVAHTPPKDSPSPTVLNPPRQPIHIKNPNIKGDRAGTEQQSPGLHKRRCRTTRRKGRQSAGRELRAVRRCEWGVTDEYVAPNRVRCRTGETGSRYRPQRKTQHPRGETPRHRITVERVRLAIDIRSPNRCEVLRPERQGRCAYGQRGAELSDKTRSQGFQPFAHRIIAHEGA